MVAGSEKHLHAARNAFAMLQAQSYATGGWGPDETLRAPGSADVYASLTKTHNSFETPCGSYAHFKLTRYLLRVTRDSRYGDSMERVMYNTVLGAKPLEENGKTFYYSDYNYDGKRFYHQARWPCCSGTLPQVATDYRINMYFRAPQAIYVNLYMPSTLRWSENGAAFSLTQEGEYPYEDHVTFTVTSSRPTELTLNFRIPEWAEGASISVNGAPPERPRRPWPIRRNPPRVEDRRSHRVGTSAQDAPRAYRCAAHRDRGITPRTAGADGDQAAAGRPHAGHCAP